MSKPNKKTSVIRLDADLVKKIRNIKKSYKKKEKKEILKVVRRHNKNAKK